ncbi:MAG TPA: hypothetical protein VEB22_04595 [Phycisphaerales bacterium]|nr:hypothetical protein [Phycisphaerales bacterium]
MSTQPPLPHHPRTSPDPIDDRLERYLDGLMPADERTAFEAEAAASPALAAEITVHRRVCAALALLASPLQPGAPRLADEHATPPAARAARRWTGLVGVAAAIALCAFGAVWYLSRPPSALEPRVSSDREWQEKTQRRLVEQYEAQVAAGFVPAEVCTTDEQFAEWTRRRFEVALKPVHGGPKPEPVLAGWSRAEIFSAYTGVLLARVDGQPVIVTMDNAPDRSIPSDAAAGPLRVFRRKVAGLWLLEVTPLTEPRVITRIEPATP